MVLAKKMPFIGSIKRMRGGSPPFFAHETLTTILKKNYQNKGVFEGQRKLKLFDWSVEEGSWEEEKIVKLCQENSSE